MVTSPLLASKHKQTWRNRLRNTFVTGLFVLLPAAITYVILTFLFTRLDTLLAPSVSKLLHSLSLPLKLPLESAYTRVQNMTQTLRYSWLTSGDDADIYYVQGGYVLPWEIGPGKIQPYFRYEQLCVDNKPDTAFPCLGLNYPYNDV